MEHGAKNNGMEDGMELMEKEPNKHCKFFNPDPYNQLHKALEKKDVELFERLLKTHASNDKFDVNHIYGDPDYDTLLDKACRKQNLSDFVCLLIEYGADINLVNKTRKKAPLHFAVKSSDLTTLQCLLNSPNINVNILDDTGSTALHLAIKAGKPEKVKAFFSHPNVTITAVNRKNETPITLALKKKNENIIVELWRRAVKDNDSGQTKSFISIRECIKDLSTSVSKEGLRSEPKERHADCNDESNVVSTLFTYLRLNDFESFEKLMRANPQWVNAHDGHQTLLQYACERGLFDFVSLLVICGADINCVCMNDKKTGLMLACMRGYYKIVQFLIDIDTVSLAPINDETILHAVVKNGALSLNATDEGQDYLKCLKVILDKTLEKLDINQGDVKGNTALHYAAKSGNRDVIFLLLDHGAYIGARNVSGEPALAVMPPKLFEAYLDLCISTNGKLPSEADYEIIFKYNFLISPNMSTNDRKGGKVDIESDAKLGFPLSEKDPLLYMSQSTELRPLLVHPTLTSYIYLKWHNVRAYFYLNLVFYSLFCLLLTTCILFCSHDDSGLVTEEGNHTLGLHSSPPTKFKITEGSLLWSALRFQLFVLLSGLVIRELYQLFASPFWYVRSLENWLEIPLFLVTVMILFLKLSKHSRNQLSAVGILFAWGELFLLIGRWPPLSTQAEMFKTVSKNFFKLLAFYSMLIFAFALSFYSLFEDACSTRQSQSADLSPKKNYHSKNLCLEENIFSNPARSIFKTVIMLTGEFDSGSIAFDSSPVTSHLLFILFVFVMASVLSSLLNGLAVSDTQDIRAKAKLVGYISRVQFISFMETMIIRNLVPCLPSSYFYVPGRLLTRNFPDLVRVLPNEGNRVDLAQTGHRRQDVDANKQSSCFGNSKSFRLKVSSVRAAKNVLLRRLEETGQLDAVEMNNKLEEYGQRLLRLEVMTQQSQKILNKILAMIEETHKGACFYPEIK